MDFNEKKNAGCHRCNNKENRECDTRNGLCNVTKSVIDKLPVRCVGDWGKHKISFLSRYIDIVGNAMQYKWHELNYIEVCSGPGRCIDRVSGMEFDGTPLSVLKTDGAIHYSNFLFIDYDSEVVSSLEKRLSDSIEISEELKRKVHVFQGDYTKPDELIPKIRRFVGSSSLNVLFVDPTDISVPWDTIRKLSSVRGKVDLIINEAIYTDFNRNSMIPYQVEDSKVQAKWESALGIPGFFRSTEYVELAKKGDRQAIRQLFHGKYIEQLGKIGYNYCQENNISGFYYLVFASKNERGQRFWQQACLKDGYGQREFDFGA